MTAFDIAGHWRRLGIVAPGSEDRTTRVHWLQSDAGFCDIRIPATRPDTAGAGALAELPTGALLDLMNGFGFAGTTTLDGDRCTWDRAIAFHGGGGPPDIGILRPGPDGTMIEDGAEAAYREVWAREHSVPCRHARYALDGSLCLVTWSQADLLLAIGTPGAPSSLPLRQALEAGERPTGSLARFWAAEYTLCRWSGDTAIATLSTNPLRQDQPILTLQDLSGETLALTRPDFHGRPRPETWTRTA